MNIWIQKQILGASVLRCFNIHALKIYLCKWILSQILNVKKVELHILL